MEIALGVIITLLVAILGWMGVHSSQCTARSTSIAERLVALEEWRKRAEGERSAENSRRIAELERIQRSDR